MPSEEDRPHSTSPQTTDRIVTADLSTGWIGPLRIVYLRDSKGVENSLLDQIGFEPEMRSGVFPIDEKPRQPVRVGPALAEDDLAEAISIHRRHGLPWRLKEESASLLDRIGDRNLYTEAKDLERLPKVGRGNDDDQAASRFRCFLRDDEECTHTRAADVGDLGKVTQKKWIGTLEFTSEVGFEFLVIETVDRTFP